MTSPLLTGGVTIGSGGSVRRRLLLPTGGSTIDAESRRFLADLLGLEQATDGTTIDVPFAPAIPGAVTYWWRADRGHSATDGGKLTGNWTDVIGGKTFSQATGSKQPTYRAAPGDLGGQPVFEFDGVDDVVSASLGGTISQPFTVIFIGTFDQPENNAPEGTGYILAGTNFNLGNFGSRWNLYAGSNVSLLATTPQTNGLMHIAHIHVEGAASQGRVDSVDGAAVNAGANALPATLFLGGGDATPTGPFRFRIAHLIVMSATGAAGGAATNKFSETLYRQNEDPNFDKYLIPRTQLRQPYKMVTVAMSDGQNANIYTPADYNPAVGAPLVIWCHGYTGTNGDPGTSYATANPVLLELIAAGYIVACSNASGNNWGNNASISNNNVLYDYMVANYAITSTHLFGISMGGLDALLLVDNGSKPWRSVALLDGVTNLADVYANAAFTASINTAYGISGDYAAKTAGHDPNLLTISGSKWQIPFRAYGSPSDATVPPANHARGVMIPNLVAAGITEARYVGTVGTHVAATKFSDVAPDIRRLFDRVAYGR